VHAVRALAGRRPRGVRVAEVGPAVLDALHLFEWADRILAIDAMQADGAPGTVYAFRDEDVLDGGVRASLHETGLIAGLRFLRGRRPEVAILGVEPETIDYGMELSPRVAAVLPRVVEAATTFVVRWQAESNLLR
jgi:hydrogenase maturation protease